MELVTDRQDAIRQQEDQSEINNQNSELTKLAVIDYKMVTFSLAGKDYAVDIMTVKEIAKAGRFTYVPNTAPFVLGVYNLRGDIIPIIDLRLFFNIPIKPRKDDSLESMIIVTVGEQTFGVVVDVIDKVVGIAKSTIQPPHPLFGDINIKYIHGIVESNNHLYVLLDINRIFGLKTLEEDSTETVSEEPSLSLVKEAVDNRMPQVAYAQAAQKKSVSAVPSPAVLVDNTEADIALIADGLRTLKKFYVTDVNIVYIKTRFKEWKKMRGQNVQLLNDQDAELFLQDYFSSCTSRLWTKEYADKIYAALPENSAKQIQVWNPGCGKGYESYSLACVLKRKYPMSRVRIYAHDNDLLTIANAPMLTVPQDVASSWFEPYLTKALNGSYSFSQEIKDTVVFEYHDCAHGNTVPNADIIFCRDLLSFIPKEEMVATLLSDFAEKLKGNGILILGEHEAPLDMSQWQEKMAGSVVVYTKN